MKVAFTGARGFVGKALRKHFRDHIILERDDTPSSLLDKLQDVDVVINLAGAPIIKRWSESYKQTLVDSRIGTTRKLVNAINQSNVKHFISTSAIGIYPNETPCDESCTQHADDFLSKLVQDWEKEALNAKVPTSILRFGVVLGKDGGALTQMLPPFKLGLGGTLGDGSMMTSWIHIKDLIRIYEYLITHHCEGIYNATAPHPVSNHTFTKALGKVLHRPTIFPIPLFLLRLLFAQAACVLTDSKEVYPKALQEAGFKFDYPHIDAALRDILRSEDN